MSVVAGVLVCLVMVGCGEPREEPAPGAAQPDPTNAGGGTSPRTPPVGVADPAAKGTTSTRTSGSARGVAAKPDTEPAPAIDWGATGATVEALLQTARFTDAVVIVNDLRSSLTSPADLQAWRSLDLRVRQLREDAPAAQAAIAELTSDRPDARDVARQQLRRLGEVSQILLRKTVREGEVDRATAAAPLLDPTGASVESIQTRLLAVRDRPNVEDAELRTALLESLLDQPEALIDAAPLARHLVLLDFGWTEAGQHLADLILARQARQTGDADIDTWLDQSDATRRLRQFVAASLGSADPDAAAWASQVAGAAGIHVPGLRGSYYSGVDFDRLTMERIDATIDIDNLKYGYPDNRKEQLSIRWTGSIRIEEPGEYTFFSASDDGQRVWVNDQLIIDDWNYHAVEERSEKIALESGVFPFKVEHFQGSGGGSIKVSWQGKGFEKQVIPAEVLRTTPLPSAEPSGPVVAKVQATLKIVSPIATPDDIRPYKHGLTAAVAEIRQVDQGRLAATKLVVLLPTVIDGKPTPLTDVKAGQTLALELIPLDAVPGAAELPTSDETNEFEAPRYLVSPPGGLPALEPE